jgi:ABC-type Zn uptake system ZnuABC Zn-binding protein ZnuA
MRRDKGTMVTLFAAVAAVVVGLAVSAPTLAERHARLSVAVTTADIRAIVKAVGGNEVDSFSLFRGCILRKDLLVEDAGMDRLPVTNAIVWTGFFNESSAIFASIERLPAARKEKLSQPMWIDVSQDTTRVGVPTSSCEGYVELQFMHGDPFLWLNPRNGAVIAHNVAEGLSRLRPERRAYFAANAADFSRALGADIARWENELRALPPLKIFSAQCGWQNFAQLGGPTFITCRNAPGTLDTPESLATQIDAQSVRIVIVDPNTPPRYGEVFRRRTKAVVLEVPSSIADLPGATGYSALFDNLIRVLKTAALNG